jgi:uncharacterized phage protein (TIGR01671 family)
MREILFRGKRSDNGEWVFGDLAHDARGNPVITVRKAVRDVDYFSVHYETVGQYAGLEDFEGKRIFEGDCVFLDEWEAGGVIYFDSAWKFRFYDKSGPLNLKRIHKVCGVVGNIHDNPELLVEGA